MEINLLKNYPQTKRDISARGLKKKKSDIALARLFDVDFFDGSRSTGYGGFSYDPRFWEPVVPDFEKWFGLSSGDSLLDVGCAKGFMLSDFRRLIPGLSVYGLDISKYAVFNAKSDVKNICVCGNATDLPFADASMDVVVSITTLHNLEGDDLIRALREIGRVAKRGSFITVDAFKTDEQRKEMLDWNLTAKTILHVDEWLELFDKSGYAGDFYWFMP